MERFKARMYLQQLSKIFGTMEETIKNTHCGLLSSKAHETSVLNDYDNSKFYLFFYFNLIILISILLLL